MKKRNVFGLDLLKAMAIIVIVIYHINTNWLQGGFVGVDLFFVISGYLLANSLVSEFKKTGDTAFIKNLVKRFVQLWSVLFVVVFFVTIYITIFNKPLLDIAHKDILPSLTFTNNWWFIINEVGYFDSFTLSPFKHLWYIALLMQAYVLIIATFKLSNKISSKNNFKTFKIIIGVVALISFIMSQVLYDPDNISRVYYGTDTRIYQIIIGLFLNFAFPIDFLRKREKQSTDISTNRVFNVEITRFNKLILPVSLVSLALFILASIYVSELDTWTYRIGFLLFALNSCLMVLTIANEKNIIFDKFRYIPFIGSLGKLSYSIYLWHYPILVLTQTQEEINGPSPVYTALRLIAILILSIITYNLVEKRSRKTKRARPSSRREREKLKNRNKQVILSRVVLVLGLIFLLGVSGISIPFLSTAFVEPAEELNLPDSIITNQGQGLQGDTDGFEIVNSDETKEETSGQNPQETGGENNSESQSPDIAYSNVLLIGDSIGVNVGTKLQSLFPNAVIDAKISRQLYKSEEIFIQYKSYDSADTAVIILLGTNGAFNEGHVDDIVQHFPLSKKIFVNVKMPNSWQDQVNATLKAYTDKHPDIGLVDWYNASKDHPEYFASDKTHLVTEGVDAMMNLILEELKR